MPLGQALNSNIAAPTIITLAVYTLMLIWGESGIAGDELGYSLINGAKLKKLTECPHRI